MGRVTGTDSRAFLLCILPKLFHVQSAGRRESCRNKTRQSMKENVERELTFTLNELGGNIFDYEFAGENAEEICREREGVLHQWGYDLVYNQETGAYMQRSVAIVEEKGTGKIYHVVPKLITMKKSAI